MSALENVSGELTKDIKFQHIQQLYKGWAMRWNGTWSLLSPAVFVDDFSCFSKKKRKSVEKKQLMSTDIIPC